MLKSDLSNLLYSERRILTTDSGGYAYVAKNNAHEVLMAAYVFTGDGWCNTDICSLWDNGEKYGIKAEVNNIPFASREATWLLVWAQVL